MADRRYRPVNFGFLNTAQDSTDIGEFESPNATNLDPDELALGALKHQQYTGEGTLKDFTNTEMGGRRFFLGDSTLADNTYTEYGQSEGHDTSPYTDIELPLTTSDGLEAHVIAFDFYMGTSPSGSSENVIRTASGTVTAHLFKVSVENNDELTFTFYDGVTTQALTLVDPIVNSQWYRVVLVHNTEVDKGYAAYVDGKLVAEQVGNTVVTANTAGEPFTLGNSTDPAMVIRLRNVMVARGNSTSPSDYNSTIRSLGFKDDEYSVLVSSKDGSGADNKQATTFVRSGSPSPSSTQTSVSSGRLLQEVDATELSSTFLPYTEYDYTNVTDEAQRCDRYLPFGDGVFVGMRVNLLRTNLANNVSRVLFTFEDSGALGTPTGMKIALSKTITDNYFKLIVYLEDGVGFNPTTALEIVAPGDSFYVSALIYDESTTTDTSIVGALYLNGKRIYQINLATGDWVLRNNSTVRPIFMGGNDLVASAGTYSLRTAVRDVVMGNLKSDADTSKLASWAGQTDLIDANVDVLFSVADGDLTDNDQGFSSSTPVGNIAPNPVTPSQLGGLAIVSDLIAENDGPVTPAKPTSTVEDFTQIDDGNLQGATPSGAPGFAPSLMVQGGKTYNGPETATIVIGPLAIDTTNIWKSYLTYRVEGQSGYPNRVKTQGTTSLFKLNHYNLQVVADGSVTHSYTGGYICQLKSPSLLDGRYQYRAVGIRSTDMAPKIEVESLPSSILELNINNIDAAGQRVANNIPIIQVPPASPGYPDFIDRVDLYRKDPDVDEYVKVFEHSGVATHNYKDNALITDLPRIEFLKTENDESFTKINDAIGNTSGNYFMLFNKDNRLWTVPSDRKDLLLYSRENEWWGWKRENSFSFNGDIKDVVTIRDINVVNGESTLVVFTTKGIYHVVGSGVEASPYVRVPMFGGDGSSEIDTYAGSALPFNGSIFFMAKSSDGGYETGAYGQKVYEYNLQQLVELSGRIKKTGTLDGDTNELEFVSLLGGDKYILKKLTNGTCLVYHKDARGWLTYSSTADQNWVWESKKFDRRSVERGTVANSTRLKIDYAGQIKLTLTVYDKDGNAYDQPNAPLVLGSVGTTRKIWENVLPSNMGAQWSFKLEGVYDDSGSGEIYNMWFL